MYPYIVAQTEPQSCRSSGWRVGDAVEALRSSIARNALVEAAEEDAWSTDPAWTTKESDEIGEFVAKRFMGKMYLGQVLAWRRQAPWSTDPDKLWYLVGTLPRPPSLVMSCVCVCARACAAWRRLVRVCARGCPSCALKTNKAGHVPRCRSAQV